MELHQPLDRICGRESKIRVLRYFFRTDHDHTGRAVAGGIGLSPSVTHKALTDLTKEGLLEARRAGRAKLYRLRRGNYIVDRVLEPLFRKERDFLGVVFRDLKNGILAVGEGVECLCVFGSVAAGRETARSDLDLLVVVATTAAKKRIKTRLDELGCELAEKYRISLSPYLVTERELQAKRNNGLPLIESILKNNRLIYGRPVEKILA